MADFPSFPWGAFIRASQQRDKYAQDVPESLAGIGEGLGKGLGAIGEVIQQHRQKRALQQLLQQLQGGQQQPIPQQSMGPQSGGQPMSAGIGNIGQDVRMPPQPGAQTPQGSPQQPFNGMDPSKLLALYMQANPAGAQELIGRIIQNKMGISTLNPLQQAQAGYYNARANQLMGPGATKDFATPEQALQFMGDIPENRQFIQSLGDRIPWNVIKAKSGQEAQSTMLKERGTWAKAWEDRVNLQRRYMLYNALNTLDKSSGGVLGSAGIIQYRSNRGRDLLSSAGIKLDARTYALVNADLAAIAQGGSPTIVAQAEAQMPTIRQTANRLLQQITSDPSSVNQPGIRKQLLSIFNTFGNSAKGILEQNTRGVMSIYGDDPWVKAHPEEIKNAILAIGMGIQPPNPNQLPALPPEPTIPSQGQASDEAANADDAELLRMAQ